jgi:hypothetical protein
MTHRELFTYRPKIRRRSEWAWLPRLSNQFTDSVTVNRKPYECYPFEYGVHWAFWLLVYKAGTGIK